MDAKCFLLSLTLSLIVGLTSNCSRDPNVRKGKYIASGTSYLEKGKYNEAAIQFQNALQLDQSDADAHYGLARVHLRLQNWTGAYQELSQTVTLQPKNWQAQVDLGNLLLVSQQFAQARDKAQGALAANSNNVEAHALLAQSLAALGNHEDSVKEMRRVIELRPGRSESFLNLAVLQVSAKQTLAAEESYKKAIILQPRSAAPLMALASFYAQQGRWQEAEQRFREAVKVEPKNPEPRAALALFYLSRGLKEKAEQTLKEAKVALQGNQRASQMLGDFYLTTGQTEKALTEYASLSKEHPKDVQIKKNYIQLLILAKDLEQAANLNREILDDNAQDVEGLIAEGEILTARGKTADAITALQSALKTEPANAAAHHYLGAAFARDGKADLAEFQWREAVRLRPDMLDAEQALAEVSLRKMDIGTLARCANALISLQPFSASGYIYRGVTRLWQNDARGAEVDFKKVITVAPRDPRGYLRMGGLRHVQRRYAEAEAFYNQALEHDPNFVLALFGLVQLYMQQEQPARALTRINEQIAKAPNNSIYYVLLGQLLEQQKDYEKAEGALQKALDLDKNNMDAALILGRVQAIRGSVEKAAENYQRSIHENPRDVRSYVLLSSLEEKRGNWQKAQDLCRRALQVDPDYPVAANNLAYSMLEHGGNTDVALTLAQTASRGLPDAPLVKGTLGWAYYQKGAYGTAIDLLDAAVKAAPGNPALHYHLGLAYARVSDRAKAKEHLDRALQIDSKSTQADKVREALAQLGKG